MLLNIILTIIAVLAELVLLAAGIFAVFFFFYKVTKKNTRIHAAIDEAMRVFLALCFLAAMTPIAALFLLYATLKGDLKK